MTRQAELSDPGVLYCLVTRCSPCVLLMWNSLTRKHVLFPRVTDSWDTAREHWVGHVPFTDHSEPRRSWTAPGHQEAGGLPLRVPGPGRVLYLHPQHRPSRPPGLRAASTPPS